MRGGQGEQGSAPPSCPGLWSPRPALSVVALGWEDLLGAGVTLGSQEVHLTTVLRLGGLPVPGVRSKASGIIPEGGELAGCVTHR